MCEALKHDIATVEALARVISESCPYEGKNGRCDYHDDLTNRISKVSGKVDIILVIQAVLAVAILAHMGIAG